MNELQIFKSEKFGEIEILIENGKEYFPATEVAKILGYKDPNKAINTHCKKDGWVIRPVIDRLGRMQEKKFINEGNLYRLIAKSNLPQAEVFESWVFDEVLPSIRKTGMYATDELLNNPDLAIKAFTRLKEEQDKRKQLEKQIEEQAPAVAFANSLSVSDDCILVREMAKLLKQKGVNTGEDRLFKYFRANGYLISKKGSDWNLPTQKSMNLGLFVIKEGTRQSASEGVKITKTPKITGKGQQYFINKFLG
jgi:toxin-antitoxin system, toxin component, bro family|nr:MAG TPA: repressor domain protein [Caudoviricetes sp.]DAS85883.1 MAG TPA: repressor domain protein [Caudoviricetes sp.]